jgi:hypothetical protein
MGSAILCWFSAAVCFPEHIGFNADTNPAFYLSADPDPGSHMVLDHKTYLSRHKTLKIRFIN